MKFKHSNRISYIRPPVDIFLGEYNVLLASILAENIDDFAYVASGVINRMEAQTHLFEKLEKYLQLREMLFKDEKLGVIVSTEDELIFPELKKQFGQRVKKEGNIKNRIKSVKLLVFFVRLAMVSWRTFRLMAAAKKSGSPRKRYSSVIRTYFDFRCKSENGGLREEYFGPFAEDLAKEEPMLVIYKILHPKDLALYLKLRKEGADFDSCLLEGFLTPFSLIKAMLRFSFSKIKLKKEYFYRKRDITGLLQKMIDRDFYSLRGIDVFIEYEAAKKIMALKPKRLYFPYENQTWEKVYPLARRDTWSVETKIIGFQHTSISYKLIMHFPALIERDLPLFPDKILTVGRICQQLLKEKAHYPCDIVEGAALRHTKYAGNGNFNIKVPHKELRKSIAYAFSYDLSKYRDIILALLKVFKSSGITVFLKMHPDYNEKNVLKSLRIELPDNIKLAQKTPWSSIYESVDCVLYDDNTLGVEGMINGVKTFMLDVSEPIYEISRMHYFNEWPSSIDMAGLEGLKSEIENGSFDLDYDSGRIGKYINLYFNVYSKEKYFAAYL